MSAERHLAAVPDEGLQPTCRAAAGLADARAALEAAQQRVLRPDPPPAPLPRTAHDFGDHALCSYDCPERLQEDVDQIDHQADEDLDQLDDVNDIDDGSEELDHVEEA